jgi:alcohol dehydrogenase class IV
MAAWMSFAGVLSVGTGLSHAIGRTIGARWNIPHGITSCLTLAEVMKVEARKSPDRLALIARAEGRRVEGLRLEEATLQAAIGVAELVEELGLRKRLRDYDIKREDLPGIARESAPADDYDRVLQLLEAVY